MLKNDVFNSYFVLIQELGFCVLEQGWGIMGWGIKRLSDSSPLAIFFLSRCYYCS